MIRGTQGWLGCASLLVLATITPPCPVFAADSLNWRTNQNLVSADIRSQELPTLLQRIASATRWHVFVEPDVTHHVSAKFKDLPPGEALHLLLGEVNFALVPETNKPPRLYVFRTTMQKATQLVSPSRPGSAEAEAKLIPNELIVRLKPGAKIDELARALGAKVIGKIDGLNAYRLQFDSADAASAARDQLASNPDVTAVDSNYSVDRPTPVRGLQSAPVGPPKLQLNPPPADGRIVVGLVDTAVQPLGNNLDSFLLKQLSVAGVADPDPNSPLHGTSMAETLLRSLQAATKGATSVQILPVDVYGPNASTTTFDVANGIVKAVDGGATILNLSLGSSGDSPFLHTLIEDVSKRNIPIFAAAGNEPVTTPFYPAAYPEVTAVTAIDQGQIASYANRGNFISLGAPGTSVIYFNNQPYYVVGTSASAAFMSGLAAGYMDANHTTPAQAQSFLRANFGLKPGAPK